MNDVNRCSAPAGQTDRQGIAARAAGTLGTQALLRALGVFVVLAVAAAVIWPTWPPLLTTWRVMPDYDQGLLLIPFIIGWIAVRSLHLPRPAARISPLAIASLIACIALWLVAYQASSNIGEQLLLPVLLWSAVWAAFGLPIALRLAVPLACLYFAIPLWEFLVPILQSVAVRVTETLLGLIGVPVHIDGVLVSIPEGTFKIAEGCAGRRYFVVCVTIAALFAGTSRMRPRRALLFLIVAAALSIIVNWLRILTVIYAGHITNMQSYLVRVEHLSFGWALFAVLMVMVCLIGARLTRAGTLPPIARDEGPEATGRGLMLRPAVPFTLLVLLLPAIAVGYARSQVGSAIASLPQAPASLQLPVGSDGWSGPGAPDESWHPLYRDAAALGRASYQSATGEVQVFSAEYLGETRSAKLVGYANKLFPLDWMVLRRGGLGRRAGPTGERARLLWLETPLGERWLVSSLYRVDGFTTSSDALEQIAYGILGWGGRTHQQIVAVASRCRPSCDSARERLARFWDTNGARVFGEDERRYGAPAKGDDR